MPVTKKEADGEHPSSHYLVVEDPESPSRWHLRVKGPDGKPDHRLMGAAWAALHGGYRGNKYEGPGKEAALTKLKAMYKSEGMDLPSDGASEAQSRTPNPEPRFVVTLGDLGAGLVRIPIAVTGSWVRNGERFQISSDDLEEVRANFAKRLNGEINVDYDHASEMPNLVGGPRPSAGRIVKLDPSERMNGVRDSGLGVRPESPIPNPQPRYLLWGWYEPTDRARELIQNREYRYISPAIDWGAMDKTSGKHQGCTLTSVALTNKPFLEEMPEIHLSDPGFILQEPEARSQKPGGQMAKKLTLKKLDAGEHAGHHGVFDGGEMVGYITDAHMQDHAKQHLEARENSEFRIMNSLLAENGIQSGEALRTFIEGAKNPPKSEMTLLSEAIGANGRFDSAKLDALVDSGQVKPAAGRRADKAAEAVERAVRAGKVVPATRKAALMLALSDAAAFKLLVEDAPARVNLSTHGAGAAGANDVREQVRTLAEQRASEKKISFRQALSEIARQDPELANRYRRAVTSAQ